MVSKGEDIRDGMLCVGITVIGTAAMLLVVTYVAHWLTELQREVGYVEASVIMFTWGVLIGGILIMAGIIIWMISRRMSTNGNR
jgi:peptidoglycan biosynthesis protein MviN/MurJ (putative lipid II flippase)